MKFLSVAFLLAATISASAQPAAYEKTSHGLDLKIGEAQVELAAATPTTFRLSISYAGAATPSATTFLNPSLSVSPSDWQVATSGNEVGIKTQAGELLIDPSSGNWTLLDGQGTTLVPPTSLGKLVALPPKPTALDVQAVDPKPKPHWIVEHVPYPQLGQDTSRIDLPVNLKPGTPPKAYGNGNLQHTLLQEGNDSRTANGVAVIPYYWSPSGYSALAVSSDDEKPAWWKSEGPNITWHVLGKKVDLYLMPAATMKDASHAYAQLTGPAPVPPRWAFGYLQGKWGWKNRAYIEDTLNHFLADHLPVDAFLYDMEWYIPAGADYHSGPEGIPGFNDFGWNPALFPQPGEQIDAYRAKGLHFVGIRKPRIQNPESLKMMHEKGWMLRPGLHVDLPSPLALVANFAKPDFRAWYARQLQPLLQNNIYGWWNDEGDGGYGSFVTYFHWNEAELAAMNQAKPGRRLWTLNRSYSPGLQRLGAAMWTGDIQPHWDVMASTPASLMNLGLAGLPYTTCDIGGYATGTTPEVFTRWIEAGVFYPIYHAHSASDNIAHFPWLFGPDAEAAIRKAMDLRYRLIPYFYSLAYENHETGLPIMRPLVMEFPDDPRVAELTSQWLVGSQLMAAPVLSQDGKVSVYLPHDDWFEFNTSHKLAGGQALNLTPKFDEIPVYIRAGTILPLGNVVQNTDAMPGGPLEVQVYPGKDATFTLAEDDGETTDYLNGAVKRTTFTWDDHARKLSWRSSGTYAGPHNFHGLKVVVFDPGQTAAATATGSLDQPGSVIPAR